MITTVALLVFIFVEKGQAVDNWDPSEQSVYYHLHQSYEVMEHAKHGTCKNFRELMGSHLKKAKLMVRNGSPFFEPGRNLDRLSQNFQNTPMSEIERTRMAIQDVANKRNLVHRHEWHEELSKSCKR